MTAPPDVDVEPKDRRVPTVPAFLVGMPAALVLWGLVALTLHNLTAGLFGWAVVAWLVALGLTKDTPR